MRIKEILTSQHKTQKWLSDETGLSEIGIGKIINGNTSPTSETIEKIAKALHVPCGMLFDDYTISSTEIVCPHCGKPISIRIE